MQSSNRSWLARRAASPPLSGPGHLCSHPHTGRSGYPLLSSRGHRLRLRPVGGVSIQGCSRAHRFLHGGAPGGTCPRRPPAPMDAKFSFKILAFRLQKIYICQRQLTYPSYSEHT